MTLLTKLRLYLLGVLTFGPVRAYRLLGLSEKIVSTFEGIHQREPSDEELAWMVYSANEYYHANHQEVNDENVRQLALQAVDMQTPQVVLDWLREVYDEA